jgi:voltage-gated potassium channel
MERINTFLKYRKIPESLQENIYQYYTYVWENKKGYDESDIMSELPASLRMKISLYLNADVFDKIPIFEGASEAMIADFVIKLKPVIFTPNDYIIKKGERGDCLYFISRGQVEVINDDTGDTIATLGVGAYFGEIALIDSAPRNATIRAREYCDLYSLDKVSFDEVIKEYPEFYEKIKIMAKKRMEENRLKVQSQIKN